MKIEIWSDYVCPFCYIGKRKLEEALQKLQVSDVEIAFKSYQLDPNTPAYDGGNYYDHLAQKFGSIEQVKQMTENVKAQAALVGLDFDFEKMKPTNTFDAHRLTKFAETKDQGLIVAEALLHAHFIDGEDVGDHGTLANIAAASGLDKQEAKEVLQDESAFAQDVKADLMLAQQFQITGVPFFIFNRKYALSGAQPTETFIQAIEQVLQEEKQTPFQNLNTNDDAHCTEDGCDIPEQK